MPILQSCDVPDNLKGASLFVMQQACIVTNDMIMKIASAKTILFQALCIRGLCVSILLFLLVWSCDQLRMPVQASDCKIIIARSLCDFCANCSYLTGVFHMPLANATAISQIGPLAVTSAARCCLREDVERRHWVMLVLSLIGVLIIIRPACAGFNVYSLFILLAVVCGCARDLASRSVSPETPSTKVALLAGITNFTLGGCLSLPNLKPQATMRRETLLWAFAALFMASSQLCMVVAMRVGKTGLVQQFRFSGILFAILAGYCAFEEVPDLPAAIGCLLFLIAGVYSLMESMCATAPVEDRGGLKKPGQEYGRRTVTPAA